MSSALLRAASRWQMPDTRTLTHAMADGTYKPANTLFADLSCECGEYLLLE